MFLLETSSFFFITQQIFIEQLLHAKHCCRCAECNSEEKDKVPAFLEVNESINEYMYL